MRATSMPSPTAIGTASGTVPDATPAAAAAATADALRVVGVPAELPGNREQPKERLIAVSPQYSDVEALETLQYDATTRNLKEHLTLKYQLPWPPTILQKRCGIYIPIDDDKRPSSRVYVGGYLNLGSRAPSPVPVPLVLWYFESILGKFTTHEVQARLDAATVDGGFKTVAEVVNGMTFSIGMEMMSTLPDMEVHTFTKFLTHIKKWPLVHEAFRKCRVIARLEEDDVVCGPWRSEFNGLHVSAMTSAATFVRERADASLALALLEGGENSARLWFDAPPPINMWERTAISDARHCLARKDALLLLCRTAAHEEAAVVGGAVVCAWTLAVRFGGEAAEEDDDTESSGDECDDAMQGTTVGYVGGLVSLPPSAADAALSHHLELIAQERGWPFMAVHALRGQTSLEFWERAGFLECTPALCQDFLHALGWPLSLRRLAMQMPDAQGKVLCVKITGARP
eukprot:NODE_5053_length_1814_cov_7.851808.p1 GENE.NODE_5053_length_1814_cov_7.851808~~NODE_5053_length_1814_cov_7.851808.p1  ORF type:complete len:523 (+),score=140.34 NODE_5053_length_1814_cov_7.851808:196-1569(+)